MVSTPALLGDECCGKISTQVLFWPDTNKFFQKKYRLLEHLDIYSLKHFTGLGLSRFLLSLRSQPCFFYALKIANHLKTLRKSRLSFSCFEH